MKLSKENVFLILARMEQNGDLPHDGPLSVFARARDGEHPRQLVVRLDGDTVFVRTSRLPFARPMVFSRQTLRAAQL